MTEDGNSLARRKVIASAGAGMGTGLLAQLAPRPAAAQDPAAKHAAPMKPWSHEYWARKGDVALYMFRKRRGDRQFVILPATAHSVVLGSNRQLFWHVVRAFLTMPAHTEV